MIFICYLRTLLKTPCTWFILQYVLGWETWVRNLSLIGYTLTQWMGMRLPFLCTKTRPCLFWPAFPLKQKNVWSLAGCDGMVILDEYAHWILHIRATIFGEPGPCRRLASRVQSSCYFPFLGQFQRIHSSSVPLILWRAVCGRQYATQDVWLFPVDFLQLLVQNLETTVPILRTRFAPVTGDLLGIYYYYYYYYYYLLRNFHAHGDIFNRESSVPVDDLFACTKTKFVRYPGQPPITTPTVCGHSLLYMARHDIPTHQVALAHTYIFYDQLFMKNLENKWTYGGASLISLLPFAHLLSTVYWQIDIDSECRTRVSLPHMHCIHQILSMNVIWKYFHTHHSPKTNIH